MHPLLSLVQAVGFDLDRTLYSETPEMEERIIAEIAKEALRQKPELETLEKAKKLVQKKGSELGSWRKIFIELGDTDPVGTASRCLDSANLFELIEPDEKLVKIIERLGKKFFLFILTRSTRTSALKKLLKIGIRPEVFQFSLFGDDPNALSGKSSKNFQYFLFKSPYKPDEHVYIGDSPHTDVTLPRSLGMKTIIVGRKSMEADLFVRDIHEIEDLFF